MRWLVGRLKSLRGNRSDCQMKPLQPNENDLVGKWIKVADGVDGDATEKRIEWLTKEILEKVAVAGGGWDILFRDKSDGRYWEHTYPKGYMHGGGPERLTCISEAEARKKYKF